MPVIDPVSLEDCLDFISKNHVDIQDGVYDVKIRVEWLTALPLETVQFLLGHCVSTKKVVAQVVKGTGAGAVILERLSRDDNQDVRCCVASNPNAQAAILATLGEDYFEEVRLAVARNPRVPDALLNQMSMDKSTYIRTAVVQNPRTPLKIMNRLASDRSKVVADAVVQLATTTKSAAILGVLAKCSQPVVRSAVCENRVVTLQMLDVLCRDENTQVQGAARKRLLVHAESATTSPKLLSQFAVLNNRDILIALGGNPSTPAEILAQLVLHQDERVRQAVAKNRSLSEAGMMVLAQDAVTFIRVALAEREDLTWPVCERLAQGELPSVMEALANNLVERERRKIHHLCLDCGKKLSGMGKTLGAKCFVCMGKKMMAR